MVMHPKHWIEIDPVPVKDGNQIRLQADIVNECGHDLSIAVTIGDDEQAAREIADRIRRIWNLFREVKDDQFGDVVICSKQNITRTLEHLREVVDDTLQPLLTATD